MAVWLMRDSLLEWQLPKLSKPCSRPFADSRTSPPSAMAHPYHARLIWSFIFPVDFAIGLSRQHRMERPNLLCFLVCCIPFTTHCPRERAHPEPSTSCPHHCCAEDARAKGLLR